MEEGQQMDGQVPMLGHRRRGVMQLQPGSMVGRRFR